MQFALLIYESPEAAAFEWAARCPAASLGAVELRPLALQRKQRITG
jgi:hypothetical protein